MGDSVVSQMQIRSPDHTGLKLGDAHHLLQNEAAGCAFDRRQVDESDFDVGLEQFRQEGDAPVKRDTLATTSAARYARHLANAS
jgi:hypothetical protein